MVRLLTVYFFTLSQRYDLLRGGYCLRFPTQSHQHHHRGERIIYKKNKINVYLLMVVMLKRQIIRRALQKKNAHTHTHAHIYYKDSTTARACINVTVGGP